MWSTILFSNTYILHYCVFCSFYLIFRSLSLFLCLAFLCSQSAPDDCIVATTITHSYTSAVKLCMLRMYTRSLHWTTDMHLYMCRWNWTILFIVCEEGRREKEKESESTERKSTYLQPAKNWINRTLGCVLCCVNVKFLSIWPHSVSDILRTHHYIQFFFFFYSVWCKSYASAKKKIVVIHFF